MKLKETKRRNKKARNINILRFIVGPETGYTGEGNAQWYYIVALAISVMITWMTKPQIAAAYTIIAGIHLASVIYYACTISSGNDIPNTRRTFVITFVYCILHIILISVAITINPLYGIILTIVTVLMYLIAPDEMGNNIFYRDDKDMTNSSIPLVFNCIAFFALVAVIICLPFGIVIKAIIIIGFMVLHYFIDYLAGECISIAEVNSDIMLIMEEVYYAYKGNSPARYDNVDYEDDDDNDDLFLEKSDFDEQVKSAKENKSEESKPKEKQPKKPQKAKTAEKTKLPPNPYDRHIAGHDLDGEDDDDSSESDDMEEPNE